MIMYFQLCKLQGQSGEQLKQSVNKVFIDRFVKWMYAGLKLKNTAILKAFGVFLSSVFSSATYSQQTFVNAIDVDFWPAVDEQYQNINEQDCKFR